MSEFALVLIVILSFAILVAIGIWFESCREEAEEINALNEGEKESVAPGRSDSGAAKRAGDDQG